MTSGKRSIDIVRDRCAKILVKHDREGEQVVLTEVKRLAEGDLIVEVLVVERTVDLVRREVAGLFFGKGELDVASEDHAFVDHDCEVQKLSLDICGKTDDKDASRIRCLISDAV